MTRKILIIEDNQDLAKLLALHLHDLHYEVELCHHGSLGLQRVLAENFALIILDIMLPGVDGMDICKAARAKAIYTPILMLTAKSSELDRVLGLEIGADDYVSKPFSIAEVLARIKAIIRRIDALQSPAETAPQEVIVCGDMLIDVSRHSVTIQQKTIELTAKEFELLVHFARHPGRVYTREQLLDAIWGYGHEGYQHTVNSHINRLRVKIESNPREPSYILTVWGVGYKFSEHH